jgi:hypothetical protein
MMSGLIEASSICRIQDERRTLQRGAVMTLHESDDPDGEPIVRHISGPLLLAVGLALVGCGEEDRTGPQPVATPVVSPETRGTFRITAPTTGSVPESTHYSLWYAHFDYWGDSCCKFALLGTLEPNGTFIVKMEPSRDSGADPYWYHFALEDVPENCSVKDTAPVGFPVLPGRTVDVKLAVTCSP